MTLLEQVTGMLGQKRISFAVIGAAAMAIHGVSRSTRDLDLLAVEPKALLAETWTDLEATGAIVDVRRGDAGDPLAGVVRLKKSGEGPIDVVIGRAAWQREAVDRARPALFGMLALPVVRREDLILLKLYAGGPQDAWDIGELLEAGERSQVVSDIDSRIGKLPRDAQAIWRRLMQGDRLS